MKEINLRDFYPWYKENVIIEVTEEVAEELLAGQRYIKASRRRVYRNKAHYSLDAEDGIEYSACLSSSSPPPPIPPKAESKFTTVPSLYLTASIWVLA